MLVFLIGVRGAGKTTCLNAISQRPDVLVLQPSTTRPKRHAGETEYDFRDSFSDMAWEISVGAYLYGMRQSEVERVGLADVGLTVFEPSNISHLLAFRDGTPHEVVIIGLDTVSDVAEQTRRVGGASGRTQSQQQIDEQRKLIAEHSDLIVRGGLAENVAAINAAIQKLRSRGGVVDGTTIRALARAGTLLQGYTDGGIQSASYDLHLGSRVLIGDRGVVQLTDAQSTFKVPPYSFVIVEAHEKAELPRFMSARFDLRVSHFMKGMILSNGPQVDPGFQGALFCMIYNASDDPIPIKRGDHFATIEFHTTSRVTVGAKKTDYHAFKGLPDLNAEILERTGSKLLSRIDAVKEDARAAWGRWSVGLTIVIAVSVALIAIPATWGLSTLSDVSKTNTEMKAKLSEAEDLLQKIRAERSALATSAPAPTAPKLPGRAKPATQ